MLETTWWILENMDRAMVGPQIKKKKKIIRYMSTNFSNFVLENYTFAPFF